MFETAPGVSIPFPEKIKEEFEFFDTCIRCNLSYEKIAPLLWDFLAMLEEPLFLVLQLRLSRHEEPLQIGTDWHTHDEVLYLDGQSREDMRGILRQYGAVLLEDGLSQFGVASHVNGDEIFIQKYKLIDIFSKEPRRFLPLLGSYGLTQTQELLTVWDTFTQETPGECRLVTIDGLDAYEIAEQLKARGMYRAKIVED